MTHEKEHETEVCRLNDLGSLQIILQKKILTRSDMLYVLSFPYPRLQRKRVRKFVVFSKSVLSFVWNGNKQVRLTMADPLRQRGS